MLQTKSNNTLKIIYYDQVGFISGMQLFFDIHKSISVIGSISKLKNKKNI